MSSTWHIPVLKNEVLEMMRASQGGTFIDCTAGGGGHSEALLEAHPDTVVISADRDSRAVERSRRRLEKFGVRSTVVHASFADLPNVVAERLPVDALLADLGISTDQLREDRGFSFKDSAALDMRMDESSGISADDVVNGYDTQKLYRILKQGGLGFEARPLAEAIVRARPITTTAELARIAGNVAAVRARGKTVHPATVLFQAIRIEVNQEFDQIRSLLEAAPRMLKPGGRLAIITFHSLEDTLVTKTLRGWEQGDSAPASWRGVRSRAVRIGTVLTRKPIVPREEEVEANPASRSARLRVFEFVQ